MADAQAHLLLTVQAIAQAPPGGFDKYGQVAVLAGAALFGAVMLAILLLISRSIRRLRQAADRLAQGDLSERAAVTGPLQLSALADSLNQMATQLQDRLAAVVQQRNELGTVLSSMVEGVIAIDLDERILSLNPAAAALLSVNPGQAIGKTLQEVVRNTALHDLVARTLKNSSPVEGELTLRSHEDTQEQNEDQYLQMHSAMLRDADGSCRGAVIVLHDVTRLRKLEVVRRDFVANVSHEVKTPVSAIKTAVETLMMDDAMEPADAQRFLQIVARQADRLTAIVDDLLSLARLERDSARIRAELQPMPVDDVIRAALDTCQATAATKSISVSLLCDAALRAQINAPLLEQAMVNLIDNALKYSPEKTTITIATEQAEQEVVISVQDQGRGIAPEHLPRVFERFYRTDQARNRSVGGTGLGLSIVKHVAQAHGGRVSVSSVLGKGSTFRIHLMPAG